MEGSRREPAGRAGPRETAGIGGTVTGLVAGTLLVAILYGAVPYLLLGLADARGWPAWTHPVARVAGAVLFVAGVGLLLWCTALFLFRGRGTPLPAIPPARLVASGPYRFTRNPIYLGGVAILAGEALFFGSPALGAYAAAYAAFLHLVVVLHEERVLERRHGERYRAYRERVPRWLGRRRRDGPEG